MAPSGEKVNKPTQRNSHPVLFRGEVIISVSFSESFTRSHTDAAAIAVQYIL